MKYEKTTVVAGNWVKASELKNGTKAKIMSETKPVQGMFKDKEGNFKMQDIAKVRFQGNPEDLNVSLNRATIYGLIDAFGEDSKDWIGKVLTVETMKVMIGGKLATALYLIPDGFSIGEDDGGYMAITRKTEGEDPSSEIDAAFDAAISDDF